VNTETATTTRVRTAPRAISRVTGVATALVVAAIGGMTGVARAHEEDYFPEPSTVTGDMAPRSVVGITDAGGAPTILYVGIGLLVVAVVGAVAMNLLRHRDHGSTES